MKYNLQLLTLSVLSIAITACVARNVAALEPVHLRCEYVENPLGIDIAAPRLSWKVTSDKRGESQAKGNVVKTWINGVPAAHWVDDGSYPKGFFGLQIHKGVKGTVLWNNIRVKRLEQSQ